MKKTKVLITAALLVAAIGGAWASNNSISRAISDPYYFDGHDFVQLTGVNVPCSTGGTGCTRIIDGVEYQLYADASTNNPLKAGN